LRAYSKIANWFCGLKAFAPLLGLAYRSRDARFVEKKDYARAIADFTACIRLNPNGDAYIDRGAAYLGQGDNDRAIADFTAMIERHPTDARAFTNRGEAYRRKGELDPKDPMAFYDRGIA
jgi:tetratricopeptide (TPR) repeat protein